MGGRAELYLRTDDVAATVNCDSTLANCVRQDRIDRGKQARLNYAAPFCRRRGWSRCLDPTPEPLHWGWSYSARDAGDLSAESCAVALD